MKKLIYLGLIALLFASLVIFQKQIETNAKIILFITEEFPQIPIKPLSSLTIAPFQDKVELESANGKIVGDLFLPQSSFVSKKPAVVIAMGIKTSEKDKPLLWHFADTMSRLGYVTFWPRLETLDKGQSLPEEPETFIESFRYLSGLPQTDSERITFVGFSVGSSIAFVASAEPQIRDKVYGLVFFGGYHDVFDYLESLASQSMVLDGKRIPWSAHHEAIDHAKGLLENKKSADVIKIFDTRDVSQVQAKLATASAKEIEDLKKYSPKEKLNDFKAEIFILHDKSDNFVPYVESVKLDQALKKDASFLLINLFEHVQPNRPINFSELVKLYGFMYKVFEFL